MLLTITKIKRNAATLKGEINLKSFRKERKILKEIFLKKKILFVVIEHNIMHEKNTLLTV